MLKEELDHLRARSASDAKLQQKLQQDLINLEKVSEVFQFTPQLFCHLYKFNTVKFMLISCFSRLRLTLSMN